MPSTNTFNNAPIRQNNANVDANWWNVLRLAGINLEQFLGTFQALTAFTLANNQSAAANVTGLSFDGTTIRSFEVDYQIYRKTTGAGATELAERGKILGVYSSVAGTWEVTTQNVGDAGVTFSITSAGQVQYSSTNITGTASSSSMSFRFSTMGV